MKIAVVQFPGSNCERETMLAIKRVDCEPVPFLWNEPIEKLLSCEGAVIVGGFSFEDRCRSGIIAALSPVLDAIKTMGEAGKPILGICNGAQILVESGLVPGLEGNTLGAALTINRREKDGHILGAGFYNSWIHVKNGSTKENAFNKYLDKPIYIPAAHAEGKFVIPEKLLEEMKAKDIGMLQYCNENGAIKNEFPINPNGSMFNLAAICNARGNVMAMMPHPERTEQGDVIFASMRDYAAENRPETRLDFVPEFPEIKEYRTPENTSEIVVGLIITDNAAFSVEQALREFGLDVKVERYLHWEVTGEHPKEIKRELIEQEVLFNSRKEKLIEKSTAKEDDAVSFLIQENENIEGAYILEHIKTQPEFVKLENLKKGIIWTFSGEPSALEKIKKILLEKHILGNPYVSKICGYGV